MSQKIVLVTGASSGFGRLTAEALAGDRGPPGRPARDVVRPWRRRGVGHAAHGRPRLRDDGLRSRAPRPP
jgi:NAD(P)-dependent dehydrogenase (short-subunit alcohol dehydrogenase family)